MLQEQNNHNMPAKQAGLPRIAAEFITAETEIRTAQKMRYEVFCEEYKVELPVNMTWNGHPIDVDDLDPHCMHLVVREQETQQIIGYTRVLTCDQARTFGRFYSSHEFDIDNITNRPGRFLEIGRTCIHPAYRNGATIAVLWAHLARFMQENDYRYLFGCASVSLDDGGATLANLLPVIEAKYMADEEFQVVPRMPFEVDCHTSDTKALFPPLLKAYTRMGAKICGAPCWDPEFNVADLFVLLDVSQVSNRYARHFLKDREAA